MAMAGGEKSPLTDAPHSLRRADLQWGPHSSRCCQGTRARARARFRLADPQTPIDSLPHLSLPRCLLPHSPPGRTRAARGLPPGLPSPLLRHVSVCCRRRAETRPSPWTCRMRMVSVDASGEEKGLKMIICFGIIRRLLGPPSFYLGRAAPPWLKLIYSPPSHAVPDHAPNRIEPASALPLSLVICFPPSFLSLTRYSVSQSYFCFSVLPSH